MWISRNLDICRDYRCRVAHGLEQVDSKPYRLTRKSNDFNVCSVYKFCRLGEICLEYARIEELCVSLKCLHSKL